MRQRGLGIAGGGERIGELRLDQRIVRADPIVEPAERIDRVGPFPRGELQIGKRAARDEALRVLRQVERQRRSGIAWAAGAVRRLGQPQHDRRVEAEVGGLAIAGERRVETALCRQHVAGEQLRVGRAGRGVGNRGGALCRETGLAGVDKAAGIADGDGGIARRTRDGGGERARAAVPGEGLRIGKCRTGSAIKEARGPITLARRLERAAGERQRVAVGIGAHGDRTQRRESALGIPRAQQRGAEEAPRDEVHRLATDHLAEADHRLLIAAIGIGQHASEQHDAGHRKAGVAHAGKQGARELVVAGACRHHRLEIQRLGALRPRGERAAGSAKHVGIAPRLAGGSGILDQRGVVIRVLRQRALEPGQSGEQAVAAAHHLTRQHDRVQVRRVERHGAARGEVCAEHIAGGQAHAPEIGVGGGIIGATRDDGLEQRGAGGHIALCRQRARTNPRGIILVGCGGACRLDKGAVRIALREIGFGKQLVQPRGGHPRRDRAIERTLCRIAVAKQQIGAAEHGIGAGGTRPVAGGDRVIARGAVIAALQGREAGDIFLRGIGPRGAARDQHNARHDQCGEREHPHDPHEPPAALPNGIADRARPRAAPPPAQQRIAPACISHAGRSFSTDRRASGG